MATDLVTVTVRIYGWDYTLKVEPQQVERAKKLAEYLDSRMNLIAKKSGTADTLKIAIRSSLTIIDELFNAQDQLQKNIETPPPQEVREDLKSRVSQLSDRLDKELDEL